MANSRLYVISKLLVVGFCPPSQGRRLKSRAARVALRTRARIGHEKFRLVFGELNQPLRRPARRPGWHLVQLAAGPTEPVHQSLQPSG